MTDGTSQGLFIVVAIVIFGIFVVLAYILFEDTLSPALASMFGDATEQAYDKLTYNSIYVTEPSEWGAYGNVKDYTVSGKRITFKSNGGAGNGIKASHKSLKTNTQYEMSFTMTKLSGDIHYIGGHASNFITNEITIDGIPVEGDWREFPPNYVFDDKPHDIKVTFTTRTRITEYDTIYIQPNRRYEYHSDGPATAIGYKLPYSVAIDNLILKNLNFE